MARLRNRITMSTLGVMIALPVMADDLDFDENQSFRDQVRDVLVEEPEILLEAFQVLEEREMEQRQSRDEGMISELSEVIFDNRADWSTGSGNASVEIVKFVDYNCGFCRQAHPVMQSLVERDDDLRFSVKELPVLGEGSDAASRLAIAARLVHGDEAYEDLNHAMLESDSQIEPDDVAGLIEDFELDATAINDAMFSDQVNAVINENHQLAQMFDISGTPSFILNDRVIRGFAEEDVFHAAMMEIRAAD